MRANKKTNEKKSLTYYERSLYQRLYFLKPAIHHFGNMTEVPKEVESKKSTKKDVQLCNYEKRHAQAYKTIKDDILKETDKYLISIKKNLNNDVARTLNDIIQQYSNKSKQISCLNFIIKSIVEFRMSKERICNV